MKFEILLVDDDRIFNLLHTRIFEKAGVSGSFLISFKSAEECLEYLDRHYDAPGTVFLVLLDISMPVLDGWDFLELLDKRECRKNTWVVMVSSSVDRNDRVKAMSFERVIDYVEKPLSPVYIGQLKKNEKLGPLFRDGSPSETAQNPDGNFGKKGYF